MNVFIENKSFSFFKNAFHSVKRNVNKDVHKVFVIEYKGGFSSKAYRFAKKQGVYNVEYVLFGERGIARGIRRLNRQKKPISLTLILNKPLSGRAKKALLRAEKECKVIDRSPDGANARFCNSLAAVLYKNATEDQILDADVMHLYRFYETAFQCIFSSCLGKTFYVTRKGEVCFCPEHPDESVVGHVKSEGGYLNNPLFESVLSAAIRKRAACKRDCEYFDYCAGACPLREGCSDFPALFRKNAAAFNRIVNENETLEGKKVAVAKIVIKDAVYPEEAAENN